MPLALEPRNGDFVAWIKFNGKSGRWYTKDENGMEVEIANSDMTAIFDLANIKTGWLLFAEGMAPDTVWDNGSMAQQPSPKHKRGFSVNVFSPKVLGGLRELSSSSNGAIVAIKDLYNAFENAPEAKEGLVPVVKSEAVMPVKSKFGTNYQPVLKIVRWVARPEGLTNGSTGSASHDVPPAIYGDVYVPPPVTGKAPASASSGSLEEF